MSLGKRQLVRQSAFSWAFIALCSLMMFSVTLWTGVALYDSYELQRDDVSYEQIEGTLKSFNWSKYKGTSSLKLVIEGHAEHLLLNNVPREFTDEFKEGRSVIRTYRQSGPVSKPGKLKQAYGLWVDGRQMESIEESRNSLRSSFYFFVLFAALGLGSSLYMARIAYNGYRASRTSASSDPASQPRDRVWWR